MTTTATPKPLMVPLKRAAEMCGVSADTMLRWSDRGLLTVVQVGGRGRRLVRYAELERLAADAIPA